MMKNSFKALAIAGAACLMPSLAGAFTGNLVSCTPSGSPASVVVGLNPGLTCTDSKNAITVLVDAKHSNQLNGCAYNASAAWDAWKTAKVSTLAAADAATINKANIKITATTFGSCNFSGDPNSSKAYANGVITFFAADGSTKVKGGVVTFFGRVAGDLGTQSAQTIGIVTKGFGVGGSVLTQVAIDLGGPDNGNILGCNLGSICPPDIFIGSKAKGNANCTGAGAPSSCCSGSGTGGCGCTGPGAPAACCTAANTGSCADPITKLDLDTGGASKLSIDFTSDGDCTGDGTPYYCCTGAGTGKCN